MGCCELPAQEGLRMFIYLCDGRVIEVARATSLKVDRLLLVLYADGRVIRSFKLSEVYFSSHVLTPPPIAC
jgi:hypothetical protein